ncbi:chemotaxis response regulator protein-glutamate methylesterase [Anoxybacter fermentans]|uniref:Protein-glutamate methylesterase/protein-glutamine glutaminase n=1 Tax=Anoxybacter fermentans TaxID=1323375 RepID=A0A3Q9HTS4_9FIRM|nr:chemotaxis response regulator protein-glutamate methylesterase [Anoxybacter fermentans]AZR74219.1 chemotaxis response regulator protein-glutamate methylesterase [Anoxybacter fermentans]
MRNLIRVLIADDSAFMRRVISDLINSDPELQVIATARNGVEALELIKKLDPDVVTLDIEMPKLNGFETLKEIMRISPKPVVMISHLTQEGATTTLNCLEAGAMDFIPKPSGSISLDFAQVAKDLTEKIKMAYYNFKPAKVTLRSKSHRTIIPTSSFSGVRKDMVVAIGTSSGGPRALKEIIPLLPANFPAGIVIVQHMPPGFTRSLAERLNNESKIRVKEAEEGDRIEPGLALLAPGNYHLEIEAGGIVRLNQKPPLWGVRPCVDYMMETIAPLYGERVIGVILTGMGRDGANGMAAIKHYGGQTIAQDEETCLVYGMPRAVIERGLADYILPLHQIPHKIVQLLNQKR